RVSLSTDDSILCVCLTARRRQMKAPQRPAMCPVLYCFTANSFLAVVLSLGILLFTPELPLPLAAASHSAGLPASGVPGKDKKQKQDPALKGLPITELSQDEAILHALNRLAYAPRPGDVERV